MAAQERYVRRNTLALGADFMFFFLGFVFWEPTVVVPTFVKELTGSDFMVGALAGIRVLMVTLPQLLAANFLAGQRRRKPLLVWASLGGRLPVLLVAVATILWAGSSPWLAVGVLTLAVTLFFISEGLNGISWPDLVGKVIPARMRGRFLGIAQLLSSLVGLGAGVAVRAILGAGQLPHASRWAIIFACAFVGFMLSLGAILCAHEEPDEAPPKPVNVKRTLRTMLGYLRTDRHLQLVVLVQLLLGAAGATFPFFSVRARELIHSGEDILGNFLIAQSLGGMVAALLCGYLVDKVGSWASIRLTTSAQVAALLAPILAWLLGWPEPLYLGAFFLLGFIGGSSWWVFTSYLLDLATPEQRPTYLAASGILTSPNVISALAVGALFGALPAEAVFAGGMVLSIAAVALAWHMGTPLRREAVAPQEQA
jgi:MFS family permease